MITLPSWLTTSLESPLSFYWRDVERWEEFTENEKLSDVSRSPDEPVSDREIVQMRERKVEQMRCRAGG